MTVDLDIPFAVMARIWSPAPLAQLHFAALLSLIAGWESTLDGDDEIDSQVRREVAYRLSAGAGRID
jgi:hypothetical protein